MSEAGELELTGEQLRAARALLRIDQKDLVTLVERTKAKVSLPSIKRFELMEGPIVARQTTIAALRAALEKAGVTFIDQNGEGPGVRLKKRRR